RIQKECSRAPCWSAKTESPYPSRRDPRYHLSMDCHRAVRQIVLVAVALVVSCDKSTAPRSTVPVAPDPTLLPVATTSQAPLIAAYDALNVPAIAAGGSYLDPTTGVKVYKVIRHVPDHQRELGARLRRGRG